MFVYLSIFLLLAFLGRSAHDRQARAILPVVLVFLLWFMGSRYYVGCDFTGYLNRFVNATELAANWPENVEMEAGFALLLASVKQANLEYMWLNVFASAIFLICTWIFCRAHPRPLMILALLFPIIIIQLAMSGLRQALALGFLMVAVVHLMRGRRIWTAAFIVAASSFHTSAVVFLPIAALAGRQITSLKVVISIVLLTPVAAALLGSRLDVYVDRYLEDVYGEVTSGGAYVRYMVVLVPAMLFFRFRRSIRSSHPGAYDLLLLFAIIIVALAPVGLLSTLALHRMNYYVMPASILMLVYVTQVARSRIPLGTMLPLVVYGVYSLSWFLTSRHASLCYIPYRSYTWY